MQIGLRWRMGDDPPRKFEPDFVAALIKAEAASGQLRPAGADAGATAGSTAVTGPAPGSVVGVGSDTGPKYWTLTWLEGRPVAESDDGTIVRYGEAGVETVSADSHL